MQPSCFGVPSVFSFKCDVCSNCGHFTDCEESAYFALRSIAHRLPVEQALIEHERFRRAKDGDEGVAAPDPLVIVEAQPRRARVARYDLTPDQERRLSKLPKKVADYLRKLFVRGLDVKIQMAAERGENPFDGGKFCTQQVAFDMLLCGGFTKRDLKAQFMDRLDWQESSAYSQVSLVWQVFIELDIAREEGCRLIPSPRVQCNHNGIRKLQGVQ